MSKPARLGKKMTIQEQVNEWAWRNLHILLPIVFILFILLFVILCYEIVGISAVESGGMRNFVNGGSL